ncbi:MAG TPA: type II toxin-antitoxin system ParD family antitoxin [Devosia sp.]|nr:type II toxin-antitoxin system ParD family antitoxin [Devosia sp.]
MKTLTISVTEHQASLLEEAVAEGKFASDSEAVRAALQLWERREAAKAEQIEWLQREVQAGIDSGPPVEIDFDEFLTELKAKRARRG